MHELGLCSSIINAVEQRAGERRVARVRVRVGRLHHVHPEAFDQSFSVAAQGTVAQDASAELVLIEVQARCQTCDGAWECDAWPDACPTCGSLSIEVTGGDELILESIQYQA